MPTSGKKEWRVALDSYYLGGFMLDGSNCGAVLFDEGEGLRLDGPKSCD